MNRGEAKGSAHGFFSQSFIGHLPPFLFISYIVVDIKASQPVFTSYTISIYVHHCFTKCGKY
jgi:hypothetical protein